MSTRRVKLRSDVLEWKKLEGEIVALDLRSSVYLAINRTGTAIWDLLLEGSEENELAMRIAEQFSVSTDDAAKDVRAFIAQLAERDLLELEEGPSA